MPHHTWQLRGILATLATGLSFSCGDTNDIAKAVTLTLYSVDGVVIPAPMTSAGGRPATIGRGFLQETTGVTPAGFPSDWPKAR
jgi:hypothetical protein